MRFILLLLLLVPLLLILLYFSFVLVHRWWLLVLFRLTRCRLLVVVQTVLHVLGDGRPDRLLHRVCRGVWYCDNWRCHDNSQ